MERYGNKLKGFICESLEEVGLQIKALEKEIELHKSEIFQMEKEKKNLEDNIDFSIEVFSPLSVKHNFEKDEIAKLEQRVVQVKALIQGLEKEKNKIKKKRETLKSALYQLDPNDEYEAKDFEELYGVKILEQQEAERQRIARDLHDTTVQTLTGLIHKMEFCSMVMDKDPERVKKELEFMSSVVKESIAGMRSIIYDLRPMTFDDIGFAETLSRAITKLQTNSTGTAISYKVKGEAVRVSQIIELTIMRLMQEACNNANKHAQANNIAVTLEYKDRKICLTVEDDGKGFEMVDGKAKGGFGLSIMKERAFLLKGDIDIYSEVGKGTKVYVEIPIREDMEVDI
ncbi:MAG: hypothetical protein IJW18_07810 [Lachnospiraceae bacterium]|nr:hypothetical protein [Lachnospiraceae bacterium]